MKTRKQSQSESLDIETNWARRSKDEKRQRVNAILKDIRGNRPWWASEPPWRVDEILANGGDRRQLELFEREAAR